MTVYYLKGLSLVSSSTLIYFVCKFYVLVKVIIEMLNSNVPESKGPYLSRNTLISEFQKMTLGMLREKRILPRYIL